MIEWIICLILTGVAAFIDYKKKIIPNILILCLFITGIILSIQNGSVTQRLLGAGIVFILGMTGLLGLGDIKLWMGIIMMVGFVNSLWCMLLGTLLMSAYLFITKGKSFLLATKQEIMEILVSKKIRQISDEKIAFAPFVFIGMLIWFVKSVIV